MHRLNKETSGYGVIFLELMCKSAYSYERVTIFEAVGKSAVCVESVES